MPEFLIEIFSEEIPSRMQERGAEQLKNLLFSELQDFDFVDPIQKDDIQTYVSPRRLVGFVKEIPSSIPERKESKRGPRVGSPDNAVNGFAKSAGLSREQLNTLSVNGIDYFFAESSVAEKRSQDNFSYMIQRILDAFPWPKSMRWKNSATTWVRPLHSILCIYNGVVVPGSVNFPAIDGGEDLVFQFSNISKGHRFLSVKPLVIKNFQNYREQLKKAKVILSFSERKEIIESGAKALADKAGLHLREDRALIDEVAGLTEWPVPYMGTIDSDFLSLPSEILVVAMRSHQKYFVTEDNNGNLANKFILVASTESADRGKSIVQGNERVLRARLADAKFFWDQDLLTPLSLRTDFLNQIVFHKKLGSLEDKVNRIQSLAPKICDLIPNSNADEVIRAAQLSKADLTTDLVGEFPELQGVVGGYYASESGESMGVATAIAEHYSPKGPNDTCPTSTTSVILGLADRIDTLVSFWSINEKPTGSKDPFALRRAGLGVIRLIVENQIRIPLLTIFNYAGASDNLSKEIFSFLEERLKVFLREKGVRHDLISAVFSLRSQDDLVLLLARVDALSNFMSLDEGADLLAAYRRASSIVRIEEKNNEIELKGSWNPDLISHDQESDLAAALTDTSRKIKESIELENFSDSMSSLAKLRTPIDAFFDHVTVNVEDVSIRNNRLVLLSEITETLNIVADFSKIEG